MATAEEFATYDQRVLEARQLEKQAEAEPKPPAELAQQRAELGQKLMAMAAASKIVDAAPISTEEITVDLDEVAATEMVDLELLDA